MKPDIDAMQEQQDDNNLANHYTGPYTREENE